MKLRELLNQIESTHGKSVPTAKSLKESGVPVVASKEIKDSTITVYKNGFAIYSTAEGTTVFKADYCGGYIYFHRSEQTSFSEEYFLEADWWVRLFLEGEDRLIHNQNARSERNECYYDPEIFEGDDAFYNLARDIEAEIYQKELLEKVFSLMTQRQKEVCQFYYLEGMNLKEIAEHYDISFQAVSITLSDVKKKFKKLREKFKNNLE